MLDAGRDRSSMPLMLGGLDIAKREIKFRIEKNSSQLFAKRVRREII